MKLSIKEKIGTRCIIADDGQRIYDEIREPLKRGETVILDFNEVRQFASPFFNFAIGQLLNELSEVKLRDSLKLENLNETGSLVVERVIENAAKYYHDEDHQRIVDDILGQQAKGAN